MLRKIRILFGFGEAGASDEAGTEFGGIGESVNELGVESVHPNPTRLWFSGDNSSLKGAWKPFNFLLVLYL